MNKKIFHVIVVLLNLLIVGLLLYLPYYLFEGRLFLGGDDTRFYYAYPTGVLKSLAFFSWNNISSLSYYIPNHHSIPFLIVASIFDAMLNSKIHLFYFLFSMPLVLGFIYFQKFVRELIGKEYLISFTTALIYVLSPITVVSHISHFLTPVWLIALVPIISYYYISFIRRGRYIDIFKAVTWSIFLSIAYYAIVWVTGVFLPILCGMILTFIFVDNRLKKKLKKSIIFVSFIISSQLFWLVPFVMSLTYRGETDLGAKVISKGLIDSFSPTVLATATGNIIYPLLTFYHRQIAFDYNWQLKNVFINYFDHVLPLSLIFVIILFLGIVKHKQVLSGSKEKIFIFFFIAFIAGLYFFTVNIGFLKYIFVYFGYIPGFSVFRNFTDKFSLGYIFIYSSFLSLCFYIIKKSFSKFYIPLLVATIIVVAINFIPAKKIINSPLWTTKNIYQTVTLPKEYLEFATDVKSSIPSTSNIIGYPQNIAAYAVITEDNDRNAYIGTSPFKFLTGVNDLSGSLSYPTVISDNIKESITKRNYEDLLIILNQINVGYVMVTNNIPEEVNNSYLFDKKYLKFQDKKLIASITDRELIRSENGNYVLYKLKNSPTIISSTGNIYYKRINPIKYKIEIKNLKTPQKLFFYDSYHPGWKIYPSEKHYENTILSNVTDFFYLIKEPIFNNSHQALLPYGNEWTINPNTIKNSLGESFYKQNKDGSIDVVLTLYFLPQSYLYLGTAITLLGLLSGAIFLIKNKKNEIN